MAAVSSLPIRKLYIPAAAGPRSQRNSLALASSDPIIAVYISGHGYGHATRTTALLQRLVERSSVRFRVRASCPRWLWPAALENRTIDWYDQQCDVGVVQSSDLNVDQAATATALEAWNASYSELVETEVARLSSITHPTDMIFSDLAPLAFDVAARLGVRSIGMANFSWDWIYSQLGYDRHAKIAAEAYAKADLLLELEPGCPMPAFGTRAALGVIGRRSLLDRHTIRARLGIAPQHRLIMPGFKSLASSIISLPVPELSVRYVIPGDPVNREDVAPAGGSLSFVDLLAAADLVVAKTGYGIIGDATAAGTPILYASRTGFPEDAYLERWLETHAVAARVETDALAGGRWLAAAQRLLLRERPQPGSDVGLAVGCKKILALLDYPPSAEPAVGPTPDAD